MKKLLLVAVLVVATLATQEANAFWGRNCKSGNCNVRSERPVRVRTERKGRGAACGTKRCGPAKCAVCPACPTKTYREPANKSCVSESYCRMVTPPKTITIPATYEKVTCVTKVDEECCVTANACSEAEAQASKPLAEAPAKLQHVVRNGLTK